MTAPTPPSPPLKIWANTPTLDPDTGLYNISTPPDAYLAVGWKNGDFPPRQPINYILNLLGLWVQYLVALTTYMTGTSIPAAIAVETSRAEAAESTLTTNLSTEATTRAAADTTNANAISTETATRVAELTWSGYTPTLTIVGGTVSGSSSAACRYAIKGKTIFIQFAIDVANFSGGSPESLQISMPIGETLSSSTLIPFQACYVNNSSTPQVGLSFYADANDFQVGLVNSGVIATGFTCQGLFIGELA